MLPRLDDCSLSFPPTSSALENPNGLLAFGGDLKPERLLRAYQSGIFPWYEEGQPLLWWTPDPRMVLPPQDLHVARSLHKQIKKQMGKQVNRKEGPSRDLLRASFNQRFSEVIAACAMKRPYADGTWITRDMQQAYEHLHNLGYAVSVEITDENEVLQGGLYGIALGDIFFGESMFSHRSGASKMAFVLMARQLANWGYRLIDCQIRSDYLASFGAREISRTDFESQLPTGDKLPPPDPRWQQPADLSGLFT